MFRIISNIVASFVRHASIAQRLDDAVSFADGQCELVANLQSELCCVYRRAEELLADVRVNQLQVEELLDYCDVIKGDNAALRAERDALLAATTQSHRDTYNKMLDACGQVEVMSHELRVLNLDRDAYKDAHEVIASDNAALRRSLAEMRAERDALRAAATNQRAAGYDCDPYDGLSPADR
jgi:hypothetical protein